MVAPTVLILLTVFLGHPSAHCQENSVSPLVEEAVGRLVELQEEDGAWPYEGVYRVKRQIPVGYRVGGTSIVCTSLLYGDQEGAANEAIQRGVDFALRGEAAALCTAPISKSVLAEFANFSLKVGNNILGQWPLLFGFVMISMVEALRVGKQALK